MTWWVDTFGSEGAALAIAVVFLVTFAIVGGLGYAFLLRGRAAVDAPTEPPATEPLAGSDRDSTVTAEWSVDLPAIAGRAEEQAPNDGPAGAPGGPPLPSEPLVVVRGAAVNAYRWLLIVLGAIGLAGGLTLMLSHTSDNLLALPGGIVFVLGLGALLRGLVPSRSLTGSFGTIGFRPLVSKIRVQTERSARARELSDDQTRRAVDLIKEGLPISEAARTVYPDFDRLDGSARQAMESALQELARGR